MCKLLFNSREGCIVKDLKRYLTLSINLSVIASTKLFSLLNNSLNSLRDKRINCQISFYYYIVALSILRYINTKIKKSLGISLTELLLF